jgi:hypothetical protein
VSGSRTIRVLKRNGNHEPFQALKLAGAMWRGIQATRGRFRDARDLAEAIEIHLKRTGRYEVTSETIFAMALRVLRRVCMDRAADVLEHHHLWRHLQRSGLLVYHGPGKITLWDKDWLCQYLHSAWNVSAATARVIAAAVEIDLLTMDEIMVRREDVLARTNEAVAQFGLAEPVPVHGL